MPDQQGWVSVSEVKPVTGWVDAGAYKPAQTAALPTKPVSAEDYLPQAPTFLQSVGDFVKGFSHSVDPRPALKLLYDSANGLGGMLSGDMTRGKALADDLAGLGKAQVQQFKKAKQAYDEGRISEAVGHTIAGALPLVGPAAANAGEKIGEGKIAEGLGEGAGLIAPVAAAAAVRNVVPAGARTPTIAPENAVRGAAVDFAQQQNIPIDAATATGKPFIATAQKAVSDSIGGAGTADRFRAAQTSRLATVGEQLAAKANGGGASISPEAAGQAARASLTKTIGDLHADAAAAYDTLRQIEADPAHLKTIQAGTRTVDTGIVGADGQPATRVEPITKEIALPVDLRAVKSALEPVHAELARQNAIVPFQDGTGKAAAFRALDRLVKADDYAPLSEVDAALSDLKSLSRLKDGQLPELRTVGQGIAAQAVQKLDAAVRKTAADAGPQALKALEDGRAATKLKYEVADTLDRLADEPVKAFQQATFRGDAGIDRLRQVAKHAPDTMPQIGRAYLDDLMHDATADGGFDKAKALDTTWKNLGPETKKLLFKDPAYIESLDHFFRVAKMMADNPNASGSGKIVNFYNPMQWAATPATYPLAKLLYSPAGVKLLTKGFTIPLKNTAAVAAYEAQLNQALGGVLQPAGVTENDNPTTPQVAGVRR